MKLKSTGERINLFDNLAVQTVGTFNELFPECPVTDYHLDNEVEIMDYIGADRRVLLIRGNPTPHKMFRDILYGIDRDKFYEPDKDEPLTEIMGHPV